MKYIITIVAMLVTSVLYASDDLVNSSFVGLSSGYTYSDYSKSGPVEPDFKLEKSGVSYGMEIGYRANENIFYTMNYSKFYFKSRSFDNFYLSANYLFDSDRENFSLYLGVLAGSSSTLWRKDPVVSMETSEKRSSNYLIGAQVGVEQVINKDLFLS